MLTPGYAPFNLVIIFTLRFADRKRTRRRKLSVTRKTDLRFTLMELEKKEGIVEDHRQLSETDDEGLWEEHFGSHADSKPHGPMSVGMEIAFETPYIYGMPEHGSVSALQSRRF